MNSLRCNNCSLLNFATAEACKRCGQPLNAPAEPQWEAGQYASFEAYPQPGAGESPFWDQPGYMPNFAPPPAPAHSGGALIFKVLITLAVVALVAFIAIPKLLKAKKTDFTNVSWTDYRSPDGKFSLSLPVAPKEKEMGQTTPIGYVQVHTVEAEVGPDGGCMVVYSDYPVERMSYSEEKLFDYALKELSNRPEFVGVVARRYVTVGSRRGLEVEMKLSPKTQATGNITCRLFWVSPRLYIVMAAGPDAPEFKAVQTRCLESFKISQ